MKEIFRELVIVSKLGLPVTLIYVTDVGMATIATIASGQYSSAALAAVGLSNILYLTALIFFMMALSGIIPITSQLDGANKRTQIGILARQGLVIAIIFSLIVMALVFGIRSMVGYLDYDPEIATISRDYLLIIVWVVPLDLLAALIVFLSTGLGRTFWPSIIAFSSLPINALFTWIFVFGKFGMPEMGAPGCAVAIIVSIGYRFICNLFLLTQEYFQQIKPIEFQRWINSQYLKDLIKVGLPIGAQGIVMFGFLSMASILIAYEGVVSLAAHHVGANIVMFSFLFVHGLTIGTVIRTGNLVGESQHQQISKVAIAAILGSLIALFIAAMFLIFAREEITRLYSDDPAVLLIVQNLLLIALFMKLAEDPGTAIAAVVQGCKDTKMIFYCRLIGVWGIAFPLANVLLSSQGLYGFWTAIAIGQLVATLLLFFRMRWLLNQPTYVYQLRDNLGT